MGRLWSYTCSHVPVLCAQVIAHSHLSCLKITQVHSAKDLQGADNPLKALTWTSYQAAIQARQKIWADGMTWWVRAGGCL